MQDGNELERLLQLFGVKRSAACLIRSIGQIGIMVIALECVEPPTVTS